jgi:dGTPase
MERMYRHWKVNRTRSQARRILAEMFQLFLAEPDVLPTEWYARSRAVTRRAGRGWSATTSPA